jgi:hypothetical protein
MKVNFLQEWSQTTKNIKGLPRPFAKYGNGFSNPKKLASKTPIPWQSAPDIENGFLALEKSNEEAVWRDNLCPFCGLGFTDNEPSIRWTTINKPLSKDGDRVFSDLHPFHLECMRQARLFCPHMKTTKDEEYEIGPFSNMRSNAHAQILGHNR